MILLKLLMFTLTFYEPLANLGVNGKKCPKGQRVSGRYCEDCHPGTYQSEENVSMRCQGACTRCDESSGSFTEKDCTKMKNAECQCRSGFVRIDNDFSTCKCDIGFGLSLINGRKECSKCEDGYFNSQINSPCKKWKECTSAGVKIPGTTTSDVVCNDTYAPKHPTPTKIISIITRLTSLRPQEGTENQKIHSTTTTTTTTTSSASGHTVTPKIKLVPSNPSSTGNHIGLALLIFGIAGLFVLTAVTCKMHITSYFEKQPAEPKNESCRRPVEESGDDSLSPLKQNAEP